MAQHPYRWTPARLGLAALIVAAGAIAVGVSVRNFLAREMPDLPEPRPRVATPPPFNLERLAVDAEAIVHGGPPKDGIPALDHPEWVPVHEVTDLRPDDRVIGVRVGDAARAYPIRVLIWHEAVNDTLGGVPIAVVYCPLCDSASVADRRLDDRTYEFGVSGRLLHSNVLLFDRTDDALWTQVGFTAISGPNAGRSLRHRVWSLTTLEQWRDANPRTTVLTTDTGHTRDYETMPYGDYFESDELRFPVAHRDDRLPVKTMVVGVRRGEQATAYPVERVRRDGAVRDAGVVLEADPAGGVHVRELPDGAMAVHTYWFAWAAFHPDTDVWN